MKPKICFITGTRAEYGLLKRLMNLFKESSEFELQIIATGMHLSPEFGLTYQEIENDGFIINKKVEMLLSADTASAITKSMGLGMIGFADALDELHPDLVVLLGDRFEILAAASACLIAKIRIAHIHGGEITEGAYDDAIRHSVTKMSHLHFVAAEEYRNRVVQLGEDPEFVFNVGGLGVDAIKSLSLLDKDELQRQLDFTFGQRNILITFHPVTLDHHSSSDQMIQLLDALDEFPDIHLIFTLSNSDNGSRSLIQIIQEYIKKRKNAKAFTSLGQLRYFSTIQFVDGVVGNSSSGLLEVPSFKKPTINIGDRQKGRIKADSVIDCLPIKKEIMGSIHKMYSPEFKSISSVVKNPYGEGKAVEKIFDDINKNKFSLNSKKIFHNILN